MPRLSENKKAVTITIEKTDHEKISELAKKERRSVSFMINEAIKEYLERQGK